MKELIMDRTCFDTIWEEIIETNIQKNTASIPSDMIALLRKSFVVETFYKGNDYLCACMQHVINHCGLHTPDRYMWAHPTSTVVTQGECWILGRRDELLLSDYIWLVINHYIMHISNFQWNHRVWCLNPSAHFNILEASSWVVTLPGSPVVFLFFFFAGGIMPCKCVWSFLFAVAWTCVETCGNPRFAHCSTVLWRTVQLFNPQSESKSTGFSKLISDKPSISIHIHYIAMNFPLNHNCWWLKPQVQGRILLCFGQYVTALSDAVPTCSWEGP